MKPNVASDIELIIDVVERMSFASEHQGALVASQLRDGDKDLLRKWCLNVKRRATQPGDVDPEEVAAARRLDLLLNVLNQPGLRQLLIVYQEGRP